LDVKRAARVGRSGLVVKEDKMFFFEKKNQKTFICLAWGHWRTRASEPKEQKFFASFFQKRSLPFS